MHLKKRFYKDVCVVQEDETYSIFLDDRKLFTPRGNIVSVSFFPIADKVCREFQEQKHLIDLDSMVCTKILYTAIDLTLEEKQYVLEKILAFAASDMLFYRTQYPFMLHKRQEDMWNPVLEWASKFFQLDLLVSNSLFPVQQNDLFFYQLRALLVDKNDTLYLYAFYFMTIMTGSVLLSLAYCQNYLSGQDTWEIAYLEEDWQMQQWGVDGILLEKRNAKKKDFDGAAFILSSYF